jgi:hypothetical protein
MTDKIKDNIYDGLFEAIPNDTDKCNEIYALVEDLEQLEIDKRKQMNKKYEEAIFELNKVQKEQVSNFEKLLKQNEEDIKRQEQANQAIKELWIIRQYMNVLFNRLYEDNQTQVELIDCVDLGSKTLFLSRKETVITIPGIRYALCVLNNKIDGVSKGLCEFYIKFNDKCHPKIRPFKLVKESIHRLNEIMTESVPEICKESGLTPTTLCELEKAFDQYDLDRN